jgi:hypothetical protein
MKLQNGKMNVGAWWSPAVVEKIDKAREGTFLSRGTFILKNVLDHIAESESSSSRKEEEQKGQGAKASNQKRQQAIDDATSNSTQPAKVGGVP